MVELAPFTAIRYDRQKVGGDLSDVIAPPYDVISPALQDTLYNRHPYNIVRVDLNREQPEDDEEARYRRASRLFSEWQKMGVLIQDSVPAVYVLAQTFRGPDGVERTRTGFFSRARLSAYDDG